MSPEAHEPPRGDAAWKAEKQRISERNEAAYARGRRERMARDAQVLEGRRDAEREERANLRTPPD